MWRKEDGNPQTSPDVSTSSLNSKNTGSAGTTTPPVSAKAPACVSQGIKIKGEVTGAEDLFVDGVVEGKISLTNAVLTVGPNATLKADLTARQLVVRGRAEGSFTASDRIQIWSSARVHGDIRCASISIEDGAELRGKVEAGKVAAATGSGSGLHEKKAESHKKTDASVKDDKTPTDAATAGAD